MNIFRFHKFKRKLIPAGRLLCFGMILGGLCFPAGAWSGPFHSHKPETANPPEPAETQWLPLGEIIQQYSETTGNRVRLSGALQNDKEFLNQVYSANDPFWLEDFNRMEILGGPSGKKEIILLGKRDGSGLKIQPEAKKYRQKFSRSNTHGVSGQAEVKQRRKGRVRSPFSKRKK